MAPRPLIQQLYGSFSGLPRTRLSFAFLNRCFSPVFIRDRDEREAAAPTERMHRICCRPRRSRRSGGGVAVVRERETMNKRTDELVTMKSGENWRNNDVTN
jgi:hypothetical protein